MSSPSQRSRPPSDKGGRLRGEALPHLVVLGLVVVILGAAAVLPPPAPGSAELRVAGVRVPDLCTMKRDFGVPCPGCGLTRSLVAAAHGQLGRSLAFHPLGLLVMGYLALQGVRHGAWLTLPRASARADVERWGWWLDRGLVVLAVILLVRWLVGFVV